MREVCVVDSVKNGLAYVRLEREGGCNGCKACVFGSKNASVLAAVMGVECKVGDVVSVEIPESEMKFGSIIIYLLPIVGLLLGLIIGKLFNNLVLQIVLPLVFCAFTFIFVYLIDKKFKKLMPSVVEVHQSDAKKEI